MQRVTVVRPSFMLPAGSREDLTSLRFIAPAPIVRGVTSALLALVAVEQCGSEGFITESFVERAGRYAGYGLYGIGSRTLPQRPRRVRVSFWETVTLPRLT